MADQADGLPVLMYHCVGSPLPDRLAELSVPAALLADQLAALREDGWGLLGLTDALAAHDRGNRVVALTFDDGFADLLEQALPVLEQVGAGATAYVVTAAVRGLDPVGDGVARWLPGPDRPALLDAAEVVEVAAAGVEIGSHGAWHVPHDAVASDVSAASAGQSRQRLEQLLGRPVTGFCYPHGYHSRRVRRQVAAAGYAHACAIGHRVHRPGRDDRFAVQRLLAGPQHGPEALLAAVRGGAGGLVPAAKRVATPGWRWARTAALRTAGVSLT